MCAMLLIDLDGFKEVNDTLGHGTGDELLTAIGPRLQLAVGADSTVARLGGDEFGIVVPSVASTKEAEELSRSVLRSISESVQHQMSIEIGASVGIACAPLHGTDADTLIQRADVAMYWAKEQRLGAAVYSNELDHNSPLRLLVVGELRDAIESEALEAYFQPKVSVDSGSIVGAEALVGWIHPVRGVVSPDDFIPVAEQTGLIRELTYLVLRQSIEQARRCADLGFPISISVNVSARTLHDLALGSRIGELLERYEVPPSNLIVEITESTVMANVKASILALEELRRIGVRLSLDDYGTGHSSLAQLQRLPLDELKIGKTFITNLGTVDRDAMIAASTVDLARRLGLTCVAEGVETAETLRCLHEIGCDLAQGYYFSRPLRRESFELWVQRHEARLAQEQQPSPTTATREIADAAHRTEASEL